MATVIITRPQVVIEKTAKVYQKAGIKIFKAACFDIISNRSVQPQWLDSNADVLIVLSVHALNHALMLSPDWHPSSQTQVLAVGPAVAKAWESRFDHPIKYHQLMNSEGVIEMLKEIKPSSLKILTTADGRDLIKRYCMRAKISYAQINTYQRVSLTIDQQKLLQLYQNNAMSPVILSATSSGILTHFMKQLSTDLRAKVLTQAIVVGAKRIAGLAEELGFVDINLATNPSDEAMSDAVLAWVEKQT